MRVKIFTENEVQEQWNTVWNLDNVERNMAKLDYPEYWKVFDDFLNRDMRLIEAGSGLGKWVNYFYTKGYNIVGIDYSNVAVSKLKEYNNEFEVILADIKKIPFKEETFDAYLSFGVLEHFQESNDVKRAIEEAYRVLKKDGVALISIPYLNFSNLRYALFNYLWVIKSIARLKKIKCVSFFEYNYTIKHFLSFCEIGKKFKIEKIVPENVPLILKRKKKYRGYADHIYSNNLNEEGIKKAEYIVNLQDNSFKRKQNSHLILYVLRKI